MYVKMDEKVTRQEDQQENVEGQHTFSSSLNILYILLTPVSFFFTKYVYKTCESRFSSKFTCVMDEKNIGILQGEVTFRRHVSPSITCASN